MRRLISNQRIGVAATLFASLVVALLVEAVHDGLGPLARPEFSIITSLPLAVYPALFAAALAAVLVRNHWWLGLAAFFVWIPFEDLVRKFTGNDLRVYFVKDAILAVALIGVGPRLKGLWRKPLAEAWLPTMAVLCVAIVMSIPSAISNPKLPFLAFHTRFLFAALFPVGAYIGQDRDRLERAMVGLAVLTAAVCSLGIVQAVIGPTFLNPALASSPFAHLTVAKTAGTYVVLRPSGPFADVSRFASWTVISVVVALVALRLSTSRLHRQVSRAAVGVGVIASFASASRAAFLVTVPVILFALAFPGAGRRWIRGRTLIAGGLVLLMALTVGGRIGRTYRATSDFFAATVNPWSSKFDLGERTVGYAHAILVGIDSGAGLGNGTGTESLSTRYLSDPLAEPKTESGWGSVGAEWGAAGLALWLLWTLIWLRTGIKASSTGDTAAAKQLIVAYLVLYLTILFSLGIGAFENYVANAFFWFLSGVVFTNSSLDA